MTSSTGSTRFDDQSWGGVTRRGFLRGAAVLGALAGVGLGPSGCHERLAVFTDRRPLLALKDAEAATLAAVAESIVPTQQGFPDVATAEVVRRFDEELSFVSPSIRHDIRAALRVLEFTPLLYGHFSRFGSLPVPARQSVLKHLCTSHVETLRAIGSNVKILSQFFYFGHPSVWAAMGYDGTFGHLPQQLSAQRHWYAAQTPEQQT